MSNPDSLRILNSYITSFKSQNENNYFNNYGMKRSKEVHKHLNFDPNAIKIKVRRDISRDRTRFINPQKHDLILRKNLHNYMIIKNIKPTYTGFNSPRIP